MAAPTFRDFVAGRWHATCYDRCKPSTRRRTDRALQRQLLPSFGNRRLDRIRQTDVERAVGAAGCGSAVAVEPDMHVSDRETEPAAERIGGAIAALLAESRSAAPTASERCTRGPNANFRCLMSGSPISVSRADHGGVVAL